ncbi:hypothetical protein AGMMS50276_31600 [Synergistales bacterium]|nr:hypothetical protein AGMMS50276_31600 [Synergistales bacterium]
MNAEFRGDLRYWASQYFKRDWKIFPLPYQSKIPMMNDWQNRATGDFDTFKGWLDSGYEKVDGDGSRLEVGGIGIVTGETSGIFVLDVDVSGNKQGAASLSALEAKFGKLPQTVEQQTGTGGRHIIFKSFAGCKNSAGKIGGDLDARGNGGYIVAAPSIHPDTGKAYTWTIEPGVIPLAECPKWNIRNAERKADAIAHTTGGITNGQRNATLTSLAGTMQKRGLSDVAILAALMADNTARCNPPLPEAEIKKIAASIGRYPAGEIIPTQRRENTPVVSIGGNELMKKEFTEQRWAVEALIPSGLSILAGAPKGGKSWIALNLAESIATGSFALEKIEIERGDVLYLALEDTERRLQERLQNLGLDNEDLSLLTCVTSCPRQNDGGIDFLSEWLTEHSGARLIIIDTLQCFRTPHGGKVDDYASDYETLTELKNLADSKGVAILVIHHTRKGGDKDGGDFAESIRGSQGISGTADTLS